MADEKVYLGKDQLALVWQLIKNAFVAKVEGKGLSTNDFTNDLLTKLTGIQTGATAVANSGKKRRCMRYLPQQQACSVASSSALVFPLTIPAS